MEWFHHHGLYHCRCLLKLNFWSFRNQKLVFPTIRSTMFVCKWPLTKCHVWQNIETCYHGGFKPMRSKPSVPTASTSFGIMPTKSHKHVCFVLCWLEKCNHKTNEAKPWTQTICFDYVWDFTTLEKLASNQNCFSKAFIQVTTRLIVIPTSPASNLATHPPPLRSILLLRNLLPIGHHLLHHPATAPKPNHSALDGVFSHHWLGKSALNWRSCRDLKWTQVGNDNKKHVGNCNHTKNGWWPGMGSFLSNKLQMLFRPFHHWKIHFGWFPFEKRPGLIITHHTTQPVSTWSNAAISSAPPILPIALPDIGRSQKKIRGPTRVFFQ